MTLNPRVWQRPSAASHGRTTAAFLADPAPFGLVVVDR
jgi:hypothetical protein